MKINNKKGQSITTQPLIYLIGLIVIAFIFIFGYFAISKFKDQADEIGYVRFKENLKNQVDKIAREYGGVKTDVFYLPAKYKYVCFADTIHKNYINAENVPYPIVWNYLSDGMTDNVFILKEDLEESFSLGKIEIESPYFMCVSNMGGKIKLRLEGFGDRVRITEDLSEE